MEYRSRGQLESAIWVMLKALLWVGIIEIAWNLLKPGGWLFQIIGMVIDNQPTSYYYVAAGMLGTFTGKYLLDQINPNAASNLLVFICAFAGSYFILHLMLPL